jgi:hypothetical protein
MSTSHAVCAACNYYNLHPPEAAAALFPGDTIFVGRALDVAIRQQKFSTASLITTLSGDFHNQRPFLPDNAGRQEVYAASAKGSFGQAVRLKRT